MQVVSGPIGRETLHYEAPEASRFDAEMMKLLSSFEAEDTLSSVLFKAELWNRINHDPVNEQQRHIINRMLDNFKGHMTTSKYA